MKITEFTFEGRKKEFKLLMSYSNYAIFVTIYNMEVDRFLGENFSNVFLRKFELEKFIDSFE